jgi:Tol biopolymer transport system component
MAERYSLRLVFRALPAHAGLAFLPVLLALACRDAVPTTELALTSGTAVPLGLTHPAPASTEEPSSGPGRRVLDHFLGAVSPDRRFITYTDWSTGDLAIRRLEDGFTYNLTAKGSWDSPEFAQAIQVISPDSRFVAYGWQAPTTCDLRVVELAGGAPRILYEDERVAHLLPKDWSPYGRQILAVAELHDGSDQMLLVSVAEGSVRVLRTFSGVVGNGAGHMMFFSPEGHRVVYDARPDPDSAARDLRILALDGSSDEPLVEHPANDYVVGWPEAGGRIFFVSGRSGTNDLWSLEVDDGKPVGDPTRVVGDFPNTEWAMFSRDGSLFYGRLLWENDVYLSELSPESGHTVDFQKLIEHVGFNTAAEWSPDGRHLAFARGRGRHPDPFVLGLYDTEAKSQSFETLELERLGGHAFEPHWAPGGGVLLGSGRRGIYRIAPQGGEATLIVGSPGGCPGGGECIEWPDWASDSQVVFARFDDQLVPRRIALRNIETNAERELVRVQPPDALSQLSASPDARRLAFVQVDGDTKLSSLRVLTIADGRVRVLATREPPDVTTPAFDTRRGAILRPAWSSDGTALLYLTLEDFDGVAGFKLWRVVLETGEIEDLGLTRKGLRPYGLSVHPDGRSLAVTAGTPRRQETWVIDALARSEPEPVSSFALVGSWQGSYILEGQEIRVEIEISQEEGGNLGAASISPSSLRSTPSSLS